MLKSHQPALLIYDGMNMSKGRFKSNKKGRQSMIGLDWIQCQMGIKTQLAQSFIRSSISIQNWQFLSHFFSILLALESWKHWKYLVKSWRISIWCESMKISISLKYNLIQQFSRKGSKIKKWQIKRKMKRNELNKLWINTRWTFLKHFCLLQRMHFRSAL